MIEIGETFGFSRRLEAEDLDAAIRLTGGRHPVHISEIAAREAGLQGRIFHGAVSAAVMTAAIGQRLGPYRIALLEQGQRYRRPVYPGDTVTSLWRVQSVEPGRQAETWLVGLAGELRNQKGELVVEGEAKVLVLGRWTEAVEAHQAANHP